MEKNGLKMQKILQKLILRRKASEEKVNKIKWSKRNQRFKET